MQLMGLLRATIQHRRRVRLLVAGNSTFEELGPLWNDSFISARELRLGPLTHDVAIGLLRQPIPVSEGFPEDAVSQEVAEAIVDRTGGQPLDQSRINFVGCIGVSRFFFCSGPTGHSF